MFSTVDAVGLSSAQATGERYRYHRQGNGVEEGVSPLRWARGVLAMGHVLEPRSRAVPDWPLRMTW